jgi:hypothetical protein
VPRPARAPEADALLTSTAERWAVEDGPGPALQAAARLRSQSQELVHRLAFGEASAA